MTYSTNEVLAILDGQITYRQLDYWCRLGAINIEDDGFGSGSRRRFNETEIAALQRLVKKYNAINEELEKIRSGEEWESILRHEHLVSVMPGLARR